MLILPCMAREWFIQGWGGQRPWLRSDPAPPQEAESCYLIHALLEFYLNTVFKNYRDKAVEFRILKSFSTLANNFIVIVSKLQPSVSRTKLGLRPTGKAMFSEDSSSLIWPWLLFHNRELQVSWKRAQALGTSSSGLKSRPASNQLGVHLQGGPPL